MSIHSHSHHLLIIISPLLTFFSFFSLFFSFLQYIFSGHCKRFKPKMETMASKLSEFDTFHFRLLIILLSFSSYLVSIKRLTLFSISFSTIFSINPLKTEKIKKLIKSQKFYNLGSLIIYFRSQTEFHIILAKLTIVLLLKFQT